MTDTGNSLVRLVAGEAFLTNANGDIQRAVGAVSSGDALYVQSGSYTLAGQLNINKSLSLIGAGIGNTTITSNSTGYGINVTADNTRLSGFTYYGPTAAGATYGIKVQPDTGAASDRLLNFAIDNVAIMGGYRTGLDLNGVLGATIDNVSVSNIVHGNGMSLTDSANVTITNSTTTNNAWGGLALYQNNTYYNQQLNNISVDGTNTFNEAIGVYEEDQSASLDMGSLSLAGYSYIAGDASVANDTYIFFQKTQQDALNFAVDTALNAGHLTASNVYVEGWTGSALNNIFTVGYGNLSGGGTQGMTIQAAVNAAAAGGTVNVLGGTYGSFATSFGGPANLTIQTSDGAVIDGTTRPGNNRIVDLRADGTIFTGFTITSDGGGVGVSISGQGVTVSGNTITNTLTGIQTTTQYAPAITHLRQHDHRGLWREPAEHGQHHFRQHRECVDRGRGPAVFGQ